MDDERAEAINYLIMLTSAAKIASHVDTRQLTASPAFLKLQKAVEGLDGRKASYALAVGLNLGVAAYVGHRLYKSLKVQWEIQHNLIRGASRLWKLATQVIQ